MSHFTENLNPAQRDAVINFRTPSLIVAGAGSGKTRVLTCRIAYMIEQGVAPNSILALTFTNKAAREMRERIASILGQERSRYIWMGTFHSVFARILRSEAELLGYPPSFTIYDTADAQNVVKSCIGELGLDPEQYKPRDILSRISLAKNSLITPQSYEGNSTLVAEDRERRKPRFADIYKLYARKCRDNGAMDFDDLLLNINLLFRDHPEALARYQERFRYILVDEYQDTNYAQYIIIRRLAQHHGMVCVVGDDAQSIYSFRGAKIENILRFRQDFPGTQTFKLEQNYRSTQTIVNAANSIISRNKGQLKKECFSAGAVGEKIRALKAGTDREEADIVIDRLRRLRREEEAAWCDMAILYRTNAQSRILEEGLRRRDIPYKIYGGFSFYQRKEIKDMLAYVRLVVNHNDDEAFRRIVNTPGRGIGDTTMKRLAEMASARSASLWDTACDPACQAELKSGGKRLAVFVEMIEALTAESAQASLYDTGRDIAHRSGLLASYRTERTPEAESAVQNIEELLNSMQNFSPQHPEEEGPGSEGEPPAPPTLGEWLQNVALLTDMDKEADDNDVVTLMTVHAAKGLEFDHVFIVGLEDNLFPGLGAHENPAEMEEERRLFYVAVTRARRTVTLSFCETRFKWGQLAFNRPSPFLGDIDPQYLDASGCFSNDDEEQSAAPAFRRTPYGGGRAYSPGQGYGARNYGSEGGASGERASYGERKTAPPRPAPSDPRLRRIGPATNPARPTPPAPRPGGSHTAAQTSGAAPAAGRPWLPGMPLTVGMRVEHPRFGAGEVVASEPMAHGADVKATVLFDDPAAGRKTLMAKFARLQIIGE